jgi:hypothetical protein
MSLDSFWWKHSLGYEQLHEKKDDQAKTSQMSIDIFFPIYLAFKQKKTNLKNTPRGHIAHLRKLGPYKNIFPISNMHFISICLIQPGLGTMILTNLPLFYVRKLSCKIQLFWLHILRRFSNDSTPFLHF